MSDQECLRFLTAPDPNKPDLESGHQDIDWPRIESLAGSHRLIPQVLDNIDRIDDIPESTRESLQSQGRAQARSSLQLTSELHSIYDALDEADIPAIPYKGPVLSTITHDDVGARQYVDIDLVVPPSEFERASQIVREQGYEQVQRLNALGEVAFENDGGATVDLHRQVLPRYFPGTLAFEDLWKRRNEVEIAGRTVPALHPADRIVVLAVHGTKHCWYRLAWVHDIATLVADGHIPWAAVEERANSLGCRRHVHLGYWLARETFDVDLPDQVAQRVDADPEVAVLGTEVQARWQTGDASPPTDSEQHRYQWRALYSWPDRLVYAAHVATIPSESDVESVRLPSSLSPIYRLVRPARLVARGGRVGVRPLLSKE